ncbi:MAG: hypothetical protein WD024_04960 [Bacillota bacterium]
MEEERVRILGMVKEGKITPEEGIKLLDALETSTEDQMESTQGKAKWFRVRITDVKTNRPKVSVNLPIGLVDWALRTGSRVAAFGGADLNGMGINLEELRAAINFGVRGKIIDVIDEDQGQHVEIIVE